MQLRYHELRPISCFRAIKNIYRGYYPGHAEQSAAPMRFAGAQAGRKRERFRSVPFRPKPIPAGASPCFGSFEESALFDLSGGKNILQEKMTFSCFPKSFIGNYSVEHKPGGASR
jgi:hypothetical protein